MHEWTDAPAIDKNISLNYRSSQRLIDVKVVSICCHNLFVVVVDYRFILSRNDQLRNCYLPGWRYASTDISVVLPEPLKITKKKTHNIFKRVVWIKRFTFLFKIILVHFLAPPHIRFHTYLCTYQKNTHHKLFLIQNTQKDAKNI